MNPISIHTVTGYSDNATATPKKRKDSLDQADFMRLMSTQLKHQDPLKPMDNSQMVAQMAQLSSVQGIDQLNKTVLGLRESLSSDQILRGAAMVGRSVWVPSETWVLPEKAETETSVNASVIAPSAGMVSVDIKNANGKTVDHMEVPADAAGEVHLQWDGLNAKDKPFPPGKYTLEVNHIDSSGLKSKLNTYVQAKVESVSAGTDGLYLNLSGLGAVPLDYILRVE